VLMPGVIVTFHEDTPISPSLVELQKWMNDFRGAVLSLSFGIENELVILALANEFGSNDHGSVGSDYFAREQQWRSDHSLQRKIDRVKPIIRGRRTKEEADLMIQKLAEYRDLRNLLAHYPCWLEPVNREGVTERKQHRTIALKLFIADANYAWEIDTAQVTEWNNLILFVRVSVENVRREMLGAPLLNADGSLPEPKTMPPRGIPFEAVLEHGGVSQMILLERK
jgi:hypothetical protein